MFERIAVIGAGTMGAGIAGQIANAGHDVLLLDLTDELARAGVERLLGSEPPALVEKSAAKRIETGALDARIDSLGDRDWVVEAIVERLDVKRELYRRLDEAIRPECVVTSNTSTIPIRLLLEGLPEGFRRRFAITHWFNPVRYMRLLELVRGEATDPDVIERLADYNDRILGKGVVRCDDTPGFLGNRVGVFALQVGIDEARRTGVSVGVADALMGRPMGIPKTGVFGLYDLIGVDLMADVVRSLAGILPEGDAFHAVADLSMVDAMVGAGLTGNKGGGGFYRRGEDGARLGRRLDDGGYDPVALALPARAAAAAVDIAAGREALVPLVAGDDAEARFCRGVLGRTLGYAAGLLGDVTDSPQAIDDAMKLGFNWVRGPFEMIDALGAERARALFADAGVDATIPDEPFYAVEGGEIRILHAGGERRAPALPAGVVRWELARRAHVPILENAAASLFAIEGDLRLVEFHSKANALSDESMAVVAAAAEDCGAGVLVHNGAQHYSAGVDLNAFLALIEAEDFDGVDAFLARFQDAVLALRYCPVPVVGAPSGLALGGGMEVLLHCDALVAHVNSVMGLVESGVGLLPAGGGTVATYRRHCEAARRDGTPLEDAAWRAWLNLGYGATGSSPPLAAKLNLFLPERDEALINRDRLYARSVARLRELADGYAPPAPPSFELAGGDLLGRMDAFMADGAARGDFTEHDRTVAMTIASVFCASPGAGATDGLDERAMYARERAGFVELARTPETRAAIRRLLGA